MRIPNKTAPRPYDNAYIPASQTTESVIDYTYKIYKGDFIWVPNVHNLKPIKQGNMKTISADFMNDGNIIEYTGFIIYLKMVNMSLNYANVRTIL